MQVTLSYLVSNPIQAYITFTDNKSITMQRVEGGPPCATACIGWRTTINSCSHTTAGRGCQAAAWSLMPLMCWSPHAAFFCTSVGIRSETTWYNMPACQIGQARAVLQEWSQLYAVPQSSVARIDILGCASVSAARETRITPATRRNATTCIGTCMVDKQGGADKCHLDAIVTFNPNNSIV